MTFPFDDWNRLLMQLVAQAKATHFCIDGVNCLPECPSCRFLPAMEQTYTDGERIMEICRDYSQALLMQQGKPFEPPFIGPINRPRVRIVFPSDGGAFIERLKAEIAAMEKRNHNAGICLRCRALKKMNYVLKRFAPDEWWSVRSEKTTYCDKEGESGF